MPSITRTTARPRGSPRKVRTSSGNGSPASAQVCANERSSTGTAGPCTRTAVSRQGGQQFGKPAAGAVVVDDVVLEVHPSPGGGDRFLHRDEGGGTVGQVPDVVARNGPAAGRAVERPFHRPDFLPGVPFGSRNAH